MSPFIKTSLKISSGLIGAIIVLLLIFGQMRFAGGFAAGSLWAALNLIFTMKILDIAVRRQEKTKLPVFILIKFPLLYLLGFLLLVSRIFPVWSILLGLLPILLVTGAVSLCQKQLQ